MTNPLMPSTPRCRCTSAAVGGYEGSAHSSTLLLLGLSRDLGCPVYTVIVEQLPFPTI